ncbi:MAG: glycosyltransferase family 61 protein, partial [Prochlorococcaceae cyanobacterium]
VVHECCCYADGVQYLPRRWTQLRWLRNLSGYELVVAADGRSVALREGAHAEVGLPGSWCVLNDIVARRNLAHFFSDLLPQLAAIRRLHQHDPSLGVIASSGYLPNVERLLQLLLPGVAVWRRPDGPPAEVPRLRVERLLLQPVAFNGGVGFHPQFAREWWLALADLREGLEVLRAALEAHTPSNPIGLRDHWLCLHRNLRLPTEAPQGRFFSNHAQLLERLADAGVLVIDPGNHDIRALYPLLRGARGFVGIHGAGLANTFLAPAGSRVIEIRPHGGTWGMLELLGRASGMAWSVSRGDADPVDPAHSLVDVDALLEQIQEH